VLGDLAHYVELIFTPQIFATVLVVRRRRCHHLSATFTAIIVGDIRTYDLFCRRPEWVSSGYLRAAIFGSHIALTAQLRAIEHAGTRSHYIWEGKFQSNSPIWGSMGGYENRPRCRQLSTPLPLSHLILAVSVGVRLPRTPRVALFHPYRRCRRRSGSFKAKGLTKTVSPPCGSSIIGVCSRRSSRYYRIFVDTLLHKPRHF
jgi:hypothetical protein